ncbi:hypothetical protein DVH05_014091 [Phytophthora capsici]|nr:hypothetical protein DVH05_014091 [Phytophthora capsici]|eukprot:jgi/Phyca11/20372/fgenesh1_pg.PHYCAscaffold_62_\
MYTDPGPPGERPPGRGVEPPDPGRATEARGQLGGEQRPAAHEPVRMTQDSIVEETQQSQETAALDDADDPAVAASSATPAEQDEGTRREGEDQEAPEVGQASAADHDKNQQPTIPEIGSAELFQAVVQAVREGGREHHEKPG